jgi:hypothetical protein
MFHVQASRKWATKPLKLAAADYMRENMLFLLLSSRQITAAVTVGARSLVAKVTSSRIHFENLGCRDLQRNS